MMKKIAVLFMALLLVFSFAGCGASMKSESSAEYKAPMEYGMLEETVTMDVMEEELAGAEIPSAGADLPDDGRKIIRNTTLTIETKAYDESVSLLKAAVDAAQGYIEYSSQYSRGSTTRSANFTCRIPAAQYGLFLEKVQGTGSVVRTEESTEDATAQYVDLDARLKSLRTQETRLLGLMEESGSLEELLAVQDKLMEVQYQIESYTGQMKALSNRIDYATVHVYLEEVETYTPVEPTFGEEIGNAFRGMGENVKNTAEFLVLAVIYLIPLWVVGGIAGLVILFFVKRGKKKAAKQPVPPVYCPPAEPKE